MFQSDFRPNETKTFVVKNGQRRPPTRSQFKVYGRFVRERNDDFAWENDRIAHRMYGPDLETWKQEPLTSSGIDVWTKRVSRLVVNDWYMTDNYHLDSGEGADMYSVGKSRGCGGVGIWANDTLHVSRNFVRSRVLAAGPIRLVFELDYEPWDGRRRHEDRRDQARDAGRGQQLRSLREFFQARRQDRRTTSSRCRSDRHRHREARGWRRALREKGRLAPVVGAAEEQGWAGRQPRLRDHRRAARSPSSTTSRPTPIT